MRISVAGSSVQQQLSDAELICWILAGREGAAEHVIGAIKTTGLLNFINVLWALDHTNNRILAVGVGQIAQRVPVQMVPQRSTALHPLWQLI